MPVNILYPSNGDVALPSAFGRMIYTSTSIKAGDTIGGTSVETSFASQCRIPANSMQVGQRYRVDYYGNYTTPGITPPSTNAKLKLAAAGGPTPSTFATILQTGAVANPTGAAGLPYNGFADIVVLSVGSNGSVRTSGTNFFGTGAAMGVVDGVNATTTGGINTTIDLWLQLAVLFSYASAANSNTLDMLTVTLFDPSPYSN